MKRILFYLVDRASSVMSEDKISNMKSPPWMYIQCHVTHVLYQEKLRYKRLAIKRKSLNAFKQLLCFGRATGLCNTGRCAPPDRSSPRTNKTVLETDKSRNAFSNVSTSLILTAVSTERMGEWNWKGGQVVDYQMRGSDREDWILRGTRSSSFRVPRNLSHHMIRQGPHRRYN